MTGYGPPDDPSEAPTGYYDYSGDGNGDPPPAQGRGPWYRNPIVLVALGLFVAILLGLAFFLLADRTSGNGGTKQTPTSPTTATVAPTTSTGVTTTTEPVAPPETTTPAATTEPTTTTAPTTTSPTTTTPTVDEGRHHHHHHDGGTP